MKILADSGSLTYICMCQDMFVYMHMRTLYIRTLSVTRMHTHAAYSLLLLI